jgi:NADH-quinone oxidoreductase subunit F
MLKRIKNGGGRLEDLDIMDNMAQNLGIIPGTTICGLADGAAWPVRNALAKFRGEFGDYIKKHQTPAFEPTPLQESIAHGVKPNIVEISMPAIAGRPTSHA